MRAGGEAAPVVKTMQHITHTSTGPTIDAGAFFSPSAPPYRGGRPTSSPGGDAHDRGDWPATGPIRDAVRCSLALQPIAAGLPTPRGLVETTAAPRWLGRTIPIIAVESGRPPWEGGAAPAFEIRRARRGR